MSLTTINPATGEKLQTYEHMSRDQVFEIAAQAAAAQRAWRALAVKERAAMMTKLAAALRAKKAEYGRIMTLEMGKPIKDAIAEMEKCAWTAEVYAEKGAAWLAEEVVEADGKKHRVAYEPMGVILAVMPWNFPFWQAFRFAIPGLLAGNGGILKHASNVTGSALAIEEVFKEAGFPDNLFRTIIADHTTVAELAASPIISGITLTGSTAAGQRIGELAGKHIKHVVLELGGSDPFIVLEDADIDRAAENAVLGRFLINNGQSCIAAKRFIVVESIAEEFSQKFAKLTSELIVGDPLDEKTQLGSLVNEEAVEQIAAQVQDALDKGGNLLTGGKRKEGKGCFYEPTLIANTTPEMKICHEEVFGPAAPIIIVKDAAEALAIANDSEFGLGGSVWTKDLEKGEQLARQLECGSAFVNSITKSDPRMPFGGVKTSGVGRELSKFGLREFTNVKGVSVYE